MARLQDFPSVTPTSTDNLLVVQSTGQGLASVGSTLGAKMDKNNPTGTGALSIGRKSGTTTGTQSTALGVDCEASGGQSFATGLRTTASGSRAHAEGQDTIASNSSTHAEGLSSQATGSYSHAEGQESQATAMAAHSEGRESKAIANYSHSEGYKSIASGERSHAEGSDTTASGNRSHSEGSFTIASRRSQHVFGEYNIADTQGADGTVKGAYIEIVGKGSNEANRSNARTLDWNGNETLAGNLTYNGDVSLSRLLNAYSFSSASALNINVGRYCTLFIFGFAQGIGAVAVMLMVTGSSIASITNMLTGAAWTNSNLAFSLSNNVLTITSVSTGVSNLTIIYGGN